MNVGILRSYLEGMPDEVEVKIAIQQYWPLEHEVTELAEIGDSLYVVASEHNDYLSKEAGIELGWREEDPDEEV